MWKRIGSATLGLVALAAVARPAHADVAVSATSDRSTVGVEDTFEVTVAVPGDATEIKAPAMRDFRIVGQSRGTEMTMQNGSAPVSTQRFVFDVRPLRTGKLTFPALTVVADGHDTATAPLFIEVVPGHAAAPARAAANDPFAGFGIGRPGSDPFGDDDLPDLLRQLQSQLQPTVARDDVLVRATVDNPHPWVGQQTTLSVHLLTRAPLSSVQLTRMPSVTGATAEDVATPRQPSPTVVDVGGRRYQSFLIAKKALFPLRAGAIEVPAIEVAADVGGFGGSTRLQPASPPLRFAARALPAGGPTDETVGRWTLSASASPARAVAGEPLTVRITADGTGDLHALALPGPVVPPGWRSYPPTVRDTPRSDGDHIGGRRTVETVIVPDRPGRFVVRVPPLPYFDPTRARHVEATSAPLVIEVAPAAVAAAPTTPAATPPAAHAGSSLAALVQLARTTAVAAAAIVVLALAAWLAGALLRRQRRRPLSRRARLRRARRHLHLAAALRSRGRAAQFYDELARALAFASDAVAPAAGLPADPGAALVAAADACNAGRFAPLGDETAAMANAWALADHAIAGLGRSPMRHAAARSSLA